MITVILVEDHALTRAGLKTALSSTSDIEVVAEASDGPSAYERLVEFAPDVAIVDIGLPGFDGVELTRRIRAAGLKTGVVVLTMHDLDEEILSALAAGADAYCVKTSDPATVITAVRIVAGGGAYFDPNIAHVVLRHFGSPRTPAVVDSPLTPREIDVLRLVAEGIGNNEIAERLHIGLGTAKGHVRDILEKLSASDRTQAAVTALRRGII
jgi:NarL family two-component system response regulator LiaR